MDNAVLAALAKWPDVPHCYGWLSLDRRGQWRLQGEVIRHRGLADFIGRNYTHDDAGNWFFQNGPQRVYVELAYTPWVFHLDGSGRLLSHTGIAVQAVESAWIDDEGSLILGTDLGTGIVDDRDLASFEARLTGAIENKVDAAANRGDDKAQQLLNWNDTAIPVFQTSAEALARTFAFRASPIPSQ